MDRSASSIFDIVQALRRIAVYVTGAGSTYRNARFGEWGWWLYFFHFLDTDVVQENHWHINAWKDDEVLAWKSSYLANCNAITVAGSIFASIGLSAFTLPNIEKTHWSARALFASSMLLGILSVTFATQQQQKVNMLNNPLAVRLWLSRGGVSAAKDGYPAPFNELPLESSVSAPKIIAIPRRLLYLTVFQFIVGFGLYVLFSWLDQASDLSPSSDYRNIFITFMVTVGTFGAYYAVWNLLRLNDDLRVSDQFELRRLGGFPEGSPLQDLRDKLDSLQETMSANRVMVMAWENSQGQSEREENDEASSKHNNSLGSRVIERPPPRFDDPLEPLSPPFRRKSHRSQASGRPPLLKDDNMPTESTSIDKELRISQAPGRSVYRDKWVEVKVYNQDETDN